MLQSRHSTQCADCNGLSHFFPCNVWLHGHFENFLRLISLHETRLAAIVATYWTGRVHCMLLMHVPTEPLPTVHVSNFTFLSFLPLPFLVLAAHIGESTAFWIADWVLC